MIGTYVQFSFHGLIYCAAIEEAVAFSVYRGSFNIVTGTLPASYCTCKPYIGRLIELLLSMLLTQANSLRFSFAYHFK